MSTGNQTIFHLNKINDCKWSGFSFSMFLIYFKNWALMTTCSILIMSRQKQRFWTERPAVVNTCESCITHSALEMVQLTVSSISGFETLGLFSRAVQIYPIVDSPCQNVEILLLHTLHLIGSGPVEGRGTHSCSDKTEQRHHYIKAFMGLCIFLKIIYVT